MGPVKVEIGLGASGDLSSLVRFWVVIPAAGTTLPQLNELARRLRGALSASHSLQVEGLAVAKFLWRGRKWGQGSRSLGQMHKAHDLGRTLDKRYGELWYKLKCAKAKPAFKLCNTHPPARHPFPPVSVPGTRVF